MHPPNHSQKKTMTIVSAEDYHNSAWVYDSTAFILKIMANMVWKEGDGLVNQ